MGLITMKPWLFTSAILGALAVICGAFAAHGLQTRLNARDLEIFETGARYQMYHALAMGLAALAMRGDATGRARLAAMLFLAGILFFSGSLYLLALTGIAGLGVITPVGGLAFIAGWICLALAALRQP
jgi:uncharacterized membrane protein YgdD (TMEM256/DUF423 family)